MTGVHEYEALTGCQAAVGIRFPLGIESRPLRQQPVERGLDATARNGHGAISLEDVEPDWRGGGVRQARG